MSTKDLIIRRATAADAGLILSFIKDLAVYEKLAHEVVATEATVNDTLFGKTPRAEVVIAELAGRAVGFALYFHNYSTFRSKPGLYLEDLFVQPDARGAGVGRALLTHLAKIAVERDCARFEWAVLDWNEPAISFYKSLGARPMAEWTVFRMDGEELRALAARG